MSRIGAKKKKQNSGGGEWIAFPVFHSEEPPKELPAEEWNYTEEQVKIACEWSLVFMLLHKKDSRDWYPICVETSHTFPDGSYRSVFWWSLRTIKKFDLAEFRKYLPWKLNEFESGRIRREGPVW